MRGRVPERLIAVAVMSLTLSLAVAAQPSDPVSPTEVSFPSGNMILRGTIYKPQGDGPFPAVVYNHGSAPGRLNDLAFEQLGPLFVERGWVFFAPYRRGQGLSAAAGAYVGDEIASVTRASMRATLATVLLLTMATMGAALALLRRRRRWIRAWTAVGVVLIGAVTLLMVSVNARSHAVIQVLQTTHLADHLAARQWLEKQRFVDTGRIATAGNSFGGIISVLAAKDVPYCAAIDAAGGAETWSEPVAAAMKAAVRDARAPVFFFQAENDFSLEPTQQLGEEMRRVGRPYEAKIYPAFGSSKSDGHSFAWRGSAVWADDVFRFLNANCG